MKWSEVAEWEEDEPIFHINAFVSRAYILNEILWENINYHRESIFTGQSFYWGLTIYDRKTTSLSYSKLIYFFVTCNDGLTITDYFVVIFER